MAVATMTPTSQVPETNAEEDRTQGKCRRSQADNNEKTRRSQSLTKAPVTVAAQQPGDGASRGNGGGAKMRKGSGSSHPMFKLAITDGPMVHLTPEAAVELPMDQEDIDQALQIVQAHRVATARPNKIGPHTTM